MKHCDQMVVALGDELSQVGHENGALDQPPEDRGANSDRVGHPASVPHGLEPVLVDEALERPAHLLIDESRRELNGRDLGCHREPDAEMPRTPRHCLSETDRARSRACYRSLVRLLHRRHMRIDVERDVEQPLRVRIGIGDDDER